MQFEPFLCNIGRFIELCISAPAASCTPPGGDLQKYRDDRKAQASWRNIIHQPNTLKKVLSAPWKVPKTFIVSSL